MKKIADTLTELIGHTPMLRLNKYSKKRKINTPLIAKIESFNPGRSSKDRIALSMIESAERKNILKPGATIIEPTSGNTGIGLALVCAVKNYHLILTMPETMSIERRKLASAYGAEIRLTPASEGMSGAIRVAEELCNDIPDAVILQQFENINNPEAHYCTTGVEIWNDTYGDIDIFIAGIGTGGTISGVGKYLKEKNKNIRIIGVEPATSAVLNGKPAGPHKIQGIGAGFVPETYDADVVDEVIDVEDDCAINASRMVAIEEGLLVGISSGAVLHAAEIVAQREENQNKKIVVLLPDTGERYLSTDLYDIIK